MFSKSSTLNAESVLVIRDCDKPGELIPADSFLYPPRLLRLSRPTNRAFPKFVNHLIPSLFVNDRFVPRGLIYNGLVPSRLIHNRFIVSDLFMMNDANDDLFRMPPVSDSVIFKMPK